ncbi:hypothetical protein [Sandaracinobacter sp.]|uniref:hypothetical protein n=1 Tax=Sandaracinobacter sp. TaxID=2487581 RepID=UPI0035B1E063
MASDRSGSGFRNDPRRLFLTEIHEAGIGSRVIGYAVSERVAFIPANMAEPEIMTSTVLEGLESLFDTGNSQGVVMRSLCLPSEQDPGGRGFVITSLSGHFAHSPDDD